MLVSPNTQSSVTSDTCHTKVDSRKSNYLWIIDDYRRVHDRRGEALKSSPFPANNDDFKWHLKISPKNAWISLHLCANDPSYDGLQMYCPIIGNVKLSIRNAKNETTRTQSVEFTVKNCTLFTRSETEFGFSEFVERSHLFNEANKLLHQDRLVIVCDVSYIKKTDIVNILAPPFSTLLENPQSQSAGAGLEGTETLFMDEEFADVTLCINGKSYRAHKVILATRSPVFKAILRTDMIEKKSNCIAINDIEESVFIEMLRYMYTGKVEKLETVVSGLLEAADKYDLEKLKIICETELLKDLSQQNALDLLMLADRYNAKNLKMKVIQCINTDSNNILTKAADKDLVTSHPHLFLEILDAFVSDVEYRRQQPQFNYLPTFM